MHDRRVIAEHYGPGIGVETPLHSHSVAKSVVNALVGILVREGALQVDQTVNSLAWSTSLTVDQLIRMSAGLPLDERGKDGTIGRRMVFLERDTASFAGRTRLAANPGSRWRYSSFSYALLSRLVRNTVGGTPSKVVEFANRELFSPLGMRNVTLEFDGAGFWLNTTKAMVPVWEVAWGLPGAPQDAFMARGYLGQYIVIVPSEDLVVVRFGVSHGPNDCAESVGQFVRDVVRALHQ